MASSPPKMRNKSFRDECEAADRLDLPPNSPPPPAKPWDYQFSNGKVRTSGNGVYDPAIREMIDAQ